MFLRVAIVLVSCGFLSPNFTSAPSDNSWRGIVEPFASARSRSFMLSANQSLRISDDAKSSVTLDVFVYDADTKELVGRSDDDATESYYEWSPARAGPFYIVVRNDSSEAAFALVSVMPRDTAKSQASVQSPNYGAMDIYYATDREVALQDGDSVTYGTEPARSGQLNLGVARVSIPRSHLMGELEGPSILRLEFREDPEKHIVLQSTTPEDPRRFFTRVASRVSESAKHEALVFVPGFSVSFADAIRRTAQIAYDLGFDGPAILYSWPSQGKLGLVDYEKDRRNANLSVPQFRSFLTQLSKQSGAKTIHLIAHSMGNQVAVKALAELTDEPRDGGFRIRHVALMAPDIDSTEFRKLAVAMKKAAGDITLYASSGDTALKASETLAGYPRAGAGGKDIVVIPGVVETIDCTPVDTSFLGVGHSYYADNTTILSDLFRLFRGDLARDRFRLRPARNAEGTYWIFMPSAR
jgi:esterase/lipase superfamily enzyme